MRSLLIALAATVALTLPARAEDVTVAVTAIVEHPALDAVRDGVKETLAAAGYKEGENLKFLYEIRAGQPGNGSPDRPPVRWPSTERHRSDLDTVGPGRGLFDP